MTPLPTLAKELIEKSKEVTREHKPLHTIYIAREEFNQACNPQDIQRLAEAVIEMRGLLDDLQVTECRYRAAHDMHGGGHVTTGYCWDKMRHAGDRARDWLARYGDHTLEEDDAALAKILEGRE